VQKGRKGSKKESARGKRSKGNTVCLLRGEFKIKLKKMNKNTMVIVSRVFIFYDFSRIRH
jgi:hypothetical protein